MDGRGRLAQSLTRILPGLVSWLRPSGRGRAASHAYAVAGFGLARSGTEGHLPRRLATWIFNLRVPSGLGLAASGVFLLATLVYGLVIGDKTSTIVGGLRDARDAAANAAG
jgi:hypothetical protein